jgi:hypothetical protein
MKLSKVLEITNFQEKGSFYKILTNLIDKSVKQDEINQVLSDSSVQFKELDNENVAKLFEIVSQDYKQFLINEVTSNISQLDVILDILIRDGNSILSVTWFEELYKKELLKIESDSNEFINLIESESKEIDESRRRDYLIYKECSKIAYCNDSLNNLDRKVTSDEFSILKSLSNMLDLSNQELRLIHNSIIPISIVDKDVIIKNLKDLGIVLYSKRTNKVYIADEIIKILREVRGKEIADKYFRRLLNSMDEKVINSICKKHSISTRSIDKAAKVRIIIDQGISLKRILMHDIYKDEMSIPDKKKELNNFMTGIGVDPKGNTLEEKSNLVIGHYNDLEKDEKLGISLDGYTALCEDLSNFKSDLNELLVTEFEFDTRDGYIVNSDLLLDHNIKPRDILELISISELRAFCVAKQIKSRGELIDNILDAYTDSDNVYIENYINLGTRDLNVLKLNNIQLNTAEIGVKYEEITKRLLTDLGFDVDEVLRAKVNTAKDKIDILINLGNNEVIIVECKTSKSTKYNKFSQCSRQIKSYHNLLTNSGFRVVKSLLIAPDFTPDFVDECEIEIDLNLSLISSEVLYNIWNGFKKANHKVFPVNLLMRDAVISDEKILKALKVK